MSANTNTITQTSTNTFTITRTDLLAMQLGIITKRLTSHSDEYIRKMKRCLRDQMFDYVVFCIYSDTEQTSCIGQLFFTIDWERNRTEVAANGGDEMLHIKNKYKTGLPDAVAVAELLEELMDAYNGSSNICFHAAEGYYDQLGKILDLEPGTLPEVENAEIVHDKDVRELPELNLKLKIASPTSNTKETDDSDDEWDF